MMNVASLSSCIQGAVGTFAKGWDMIGRGASREQRVQSVLEFCLFRTPLSQRRIGVSIMCRMEGPHPLDVRGHDFPQ